MPWKQWRKLLRQQFPEIIAANETDLKTAEADHLAPALYSRLKLGESKLRSAIAGVKDVAKLPDPIGVSQIHRELDTGLILKRSNLSVRGLRHYF